MSILPNPVAVAGGQFRLTDVLKGWRLVGGRTSYDPAEVTWQDGMLSLHRAPDSRSRFCMSFAGVADFEVNPEARLIVVDQRHSPSPETLRHLVLDQIWPRVLAHCGTFVLHGAGVSAANGAVLLIGATRSGKSTLAASLHGRGYPMMGDDAMIVSTEDHPKARAVYQSLRLFPDSIAQVIGRDAKRSPVADYIEKWNIEFSDPPSAEEPLPIRAIFLLDTQVTTEISLERVDGAAAAFALLEQSFALDPIDAAMASDRLRQASVIAQQVPFFALAYPRNYGDLAAVHEVIVNAASAGRALAE